MISFILPVCNAADTVEPVLQAVAAFDGEPHELIVVDDGSTDGTAAIAEQYATRVIPLEESHGPAEARNLAAAVAQGEVLFFLDSDIHITVPMIDEIVRLTREHPDMLGVSSGTSCSPLNAGFFPRLCALQEHFYQLEFVRSPAPDGFHYVNTRFGTLRKSDFDKVGGFNPDFRRPSLEDLDLSIRLHKVGRFIFASDVQVPHHWPANIAALWRRYLRNSFLWSSRIGPQTRRFDRMLATGRRGASVLCGFGGLATLAMSVVLPGWYRPAAVILAACLLTAHFGLNRPIYSFFRQQSGFLFSLAAAASVLSFTVPITLGGILGSLAGIVSRTQRS